MNIIDHIRQSVGVNRTGSELVFNNISAFYNADTPSDSSTITLNEDNPIKGMFCIFYNDGTVEPSINALSTYDYYLKGTWVSGKRNAYIFYFNGVRFEGNIDNQDDYSPPLPPASILFSDTFDGTVIDTAKWDLTNPDNTVITFTQNDDLTIQSTSPSSAISSALNFLATDSNFNATTTKVLSFDIRSLKQDTFGGWSVGFSSYPNGGDDFLAIFSPLGDTGNFIRLQAQENASDVIASTVKAIDVESAFTSFKILITPTDTTFYVWSTGLNDWDVLETTSHTWTTTNFKVRIGQGHNDADSDQNRNIYDNIYVTDSDFSSRYPM